MDKKYARDQEHVLDRLSQPDFYPSGPLSVERIDTHCASVFLAGNRAYKIKRAVCLGYLDFSTLARRKAACDRELTINRVAAPQLYLGVLPIARDDFGNLSLNGGGEPVDWVIEMVRFNQDALLDRQAHSGHLSIEICEELADVIVHYHALAPIVTGEKGQAILGKVIASLARNLLSPASPSAAAPADKLVATFRDVLADVGHILEKRSRAGFIRRCHGDLHLGNIVLIHGRPTPFDAIEFSEEIATIDVLYDAAFTLMDLLKRGLKPQASALFNRYLARADATANYEALAIMPLLLALRAGVRAMVAVDRLAQTNVPNVVKENEIHDYLALASSLIERQPPRLIAIGGLSGTGKSTLARALAPEIGNTPGAVHLRSDIERKIMLGAEISERLPQCRYTSETTREVYERLYEKASATLSSGHSVVIDAVLLKHDERRKIQQIANRANAEFVGLWLMAGTDELFKRVKARRGDASDADARIVEMQLAEDAGQIDWIRLSAHGTREDVLARAGQMIQSS